MMNMNFIEKLYLKEIIINIWPANTVMQHSQLTGRFRFNVN